MFGAMNPLIKTREHRIRVARRLTKIFNAWQLSSDERICLLGLRRQGLATLERYSRGCPLAQKTELLERAVLLLEIHLSLEGCHGPRGQHRDWLCAENQYLSFDDPLTKMLEGLEQLRRVRNLAGGTLLGQEGFRVKWVSYFSNLKLVRIDKTPPSPSPNANISAEGRMRVARKVQQYKPP
jgi:hypothetical protein